MKIPALYGFLFCADVFCGAMTSPLYGAQIVADHTVVELYDEIPLCWINEVKKMWLNVPGESHSLGYRKGLELLEQENSLFAASITESGAPEAFRSDALRASSATWGNVAHPGLWGYTYGEEDFWTSELAVVHTKAHLAYANTSDLAIAAFGFVWCWDMTWHNEPGGTVDPVYKVRWAGSSVGGPGGDRRWGLDDGDNDLTGNTVNMSDYLDAVDAYRTYCESNNYPTKVFFTTGPVDGYTGEDGYQRHLKHEHIRQHVLADENRILFDYADILCYSDAAELNELSWTDADGGVHRFPHIHPENMKDMNGGYAEDGDHIGEAGAIRLAKAQWWMLARMAGWEDGASTTTSIADITTTATTTATATTTIGDLHCPAEELLGLESRQMLNGLRAVRDKRLVWTAHGRILIMLYYLHSAEITEILANNQDIRLRARELIFELLPQLQAEGAPALRQKQVASICSLLLTVREQSSPCLATTITLLLKGIELECLRSKS